MSKTAVFEQQEVFRIVCSFMRGAIVLKSLTTVCRRFSSFRNQGTAKVNHEMRIPNITKLKRKVFISFAHEDSIFAERLGRYLTASGFSVWIDKDNIRPGTLDWEVAVRHGLEKSFAVVLVASRRSANSNYVRAECKLGQIAGLRIIPIWCSGEIWEECVALGLIDAQYIDLRDDKYATGLKRLQSELSICLEKALPPFIILDDISPGNNPSLSYPPAGYVALLLQNFNDKRKYSDSDCVFIRISQYKSIGQFLDDVYVRYLSRYFQPFRYGSDWLLLGTHFYNDAIYSVIAPLRWLDGNNYSQEDIFDWAASTSPDICGLRSRSILMPGSIDNNEFIGIKIRDKRLIEAMYDNPKSLYSAVGRGLFKPTSPLKSLDVGESYEILSKNSFLLDAWPLDLHSPSVMEQAKLDNDTVEKFVRRWGRRM